MEALFVTAIIEKIQETTGIQIKWRPLPAMAASMKTSIKDGYIKLVINRTTYDFPAEIKPVVYTYAVPKLLQHQKKNKDLIVIAKTIQPAAKKALKEAKVNYMDAAGNIFLRFGESLIYVDGLKQESNPTTMKKKPFNKAGLKVVFALFIYDHLINDTMRTIAEKSGVSLDSVHKTIKGLHQSGFLLSMGKKKRIWNNKKELLKQWIISFDHRLKPDLLLGTFRFVSDEDNYRWEQITLNEDKTLWGGEPAGAILTGKLTPGKFTLYTEETIASLIKSYKLMPDLDGTIKVYKKFWNGHPSRGNVVPDLLAYADLINIGNTRAIEAAQNIYINRLQSGFD